MSPIAATLGLFAVFALTVGAAALAARSVGRPIPGACLFLFAALAILFLSPGVLRNRAPFGAHQAFLVEPGPPPKGPRASAWVDDVVHQIVPWHVAVRRAWMGGELPLRNAWNGCGMVLDGNGQSAAFSPMTVAGFAVPPLAALSLWGAMRLFLCLCGFWLWLTELSVSGRSAVFGAVCFGLSLSMTGWIFFPITAAICLWPWALFLVERLAGAVRRRRAGAALALLFSVWALSGHLETVVSAAFATALWLGARLGLGDRAAVRRLLAPAAAAAALAVGLSAFSLLPQAAAILASNRFALYPKPFWSAILSIAPHGAAWKGGALTVLFPRIFGDNTAAPMMAGSAGAFPEMAQGYAGILAAALAFLILRPGSQRPAAEKALIAPAAFGLGAAVGLWPFAEVFSSIPLVRQMLPLRGLTWFALAAAAVAAFELDRLARDLDRRTSARVGPIAALAVMLALTIFVWRGARGRFVAAGALQAGRDAFGLEIAALAIGLGVFAALAGRARRFQEWGIPLLTVIAAAELFVQGVRLYQWEDPAKLFRATPLVDFLRSQPGPFRVVGEGATLFPNVNVLAGVEDVRVHDATERREYVEFLDAAAGYDPKEYFKALARIDSPALDFMNVRFLVSIPGRPAPSDRWEPAYSGPDGTVFRNRRVLPRVFAPPRVLSGRDAPARDRWRDFDWSREAFLDRDLGEGAAPGSSNGPAEVSEYRERANAVAFRVRAPKDRGAVLVASLVDDGGWRARDESGKTLPVGRANGPFLALLAPPGEHRIRLDYRPPGFRAGAAISILSLAVAIVAIARMRRP